MSSNNHLVLVHGGTLVRGFMPGRLTRTRWVASLPQQTDLPEPSNCFFGCSYTIDSWPLVERLIKERSRTSFSLEAERQGLDLPSEVQNLERFAADVKDTPTHPRACRTILDRRR